MAHMTVISWCLLKGPKGFKMCSKDPDCVNMSSSEQEYVGSDFIHMTGPTIRRPEEENMERNESGMLSCFAWRRGCC
jgi:hypothetical protein